MTSGDVVEEKVVTAHVVAKVTPTPLPRPFTPKPLPTPE